MDGAEVLLGETEFEETAGSESVAKLRKRLEELLREAADVEVQLSRADGAIKGVPHYSVIERRAHQLGKQLSRTVQEQQMRELNAAQATTAKCPDCGTRCTVRWQTRIVKSVDGDTELQELVGDCARCRRSFFPAA